MQETNTPSPTAPVSPKEKSFRIMLWLVAMGFFMETLDSTIVNTTLPTMAKSLGENPLQMYAVVISYSLTIALLIPASGWVADRFGIRRVYMTAIVLFTVGSLLCALSQSLNQIVISRVVQGLGGSMLLPIGRLAVLRCYPKEKYLEAISFVAVPGLIGPLIGPTLGGFLSEVASWHWIFLINIPIGIAGLIATLFYMPVIASVPRKRFDFSGYTMLAVSMVTLSLALNGLSNLGFQHATVIVLMIFGLAGLIAYGLHAWRASEPLFPLSLFKSHSFTVGLAGNLFARIGSSGIPFLIPLLLQVGLHYSPLQAGLAMVPVALAAMISKSIVSRVIGSIGYRTFLVSNTFLLGLMIASFALVSPAEPSWVRAVQLGLFGALNSLQYSAMNSLTLRDLAAAEAGGGNSLFSMVQMLALSFGVATSGAILTAFSTEFAEDTGSLRPFQATFICVGLITSASAWIFWQLRPAPRMADRGLEKPQSERHS